MRSCAVETKLEEMREEFTSQIQQFQQNMNDAVRAAEQMAQERDMYKKQVSDGQTINSALATSSSDNDLS